MVKTQSFIIARMDETGTKIQGDKEKKKKRERKCTE